MALLTGNWWWDVVAFVIALISVFVAWIQHSRGYWMRKGLQSPPTVFLLGNAYEVITLAQSQADFFLRLYKYFKDLKLRHGGIYFLTTPSYMPVDPAIVKDILLQNFDHFVDRGLYVNEKGDPLSAHLFSLSGEKWRNLRVKLTPTFTSGKMKMMFDTLRNCSEELTTVLNEKSNNTGPLDIKDILQRFTIDIIGSCAFGIDCDSLNRPNNEFANFGQAFFQTDFWWNIKQFACFLAPNFMLKLNAKTIKPSITKFFMGLVKDNIDYREKNNIYRKDFMHLLLQLKNRGELVDDESVLTDNTAKGKINSVNDVELTVEQIAAQSFLFFLAGFETSSTTMAFCLLLLAQHPEIQDKVRKEVFEVFKKHDDQLTYDSVQEMTYLQQVIDETLRLFPPFSSLTRVCTKQYKIPDTDVVLEKGMQVMISIIGMHRDEEYFPAPDKFDPDRFSFENSHNIVHCAYLPFGDGPRNCIGMRFGVMQTKVGLCVLLKNYRFGVNSKTQLPIRTDKSSGITAVEGGIWLDYEKIK